MNKKTVIAASVAIAVIVAIFASWNFVKAFRPDVPASASSDAAPGAGSQKKLTAEELASKIKAAEDTIALSPDSPKSERAYLELAEALEEKPDLAKARETYQKFIERFPASASLLGAQEAIGRINVRMLFSSDPTPGTIVYEVQKGDTLTKIAKRFGTTVDLIAASNNIKSGNIRIGRKLKVAKIKFSIVVDKAQNILTLKADGDVFKTYRVSTGKSASTTPVGTFKIINKIVDPPWYPEGAPMIPAGDPRNVLGSRWLGISKQSYGIHGTTDPSSIGKSVTEGCVRLKNSEVEELYSMVPEGTEVVIID